MNFSYRPAQANELPQIFDLLKSAATTLQAKKVKQWSFWLHPPADKIEWVRQGFAQNEFYFIENEQKIIGMFRLSAHDELYWGVQHDKAYYIHSLVVKESFAGNQIGTKIIDSIAAAAVKEDIFMLRLDCNAANEKLCNYYEQQGFRKVGQKQMPHSLNNLYQKDL